jgi:putative protease
MNEKITEFRDYRAKMSAKKYIHPSKTDLSIGEMQKQKKGIPNTAVPYPYDSFHFENNISNRLAMQFFRHHGLELPEMAVEKRAVTGRLQVMITKHCIQHELGFCKRFEGTFPDEFSLPFSLEDGSSVFELEFDCKLCLMRVFKEM